MRPDVATLEREDIALFIDAASACTGQTEFYGADREQRIGLAFLHDYVLGNYRRLYGLCLVAGINDYNRGRIVERLLAAGTPRDPTAKAEEAALLRHALQNLPPQRVYRVFRALREARVNNRRTRAVLRTWLAGRDLAFDALKYRGLLRSAARHARLRLPDELHAFLFDGPHTRKRWENPLLDAFRRARYDQSAIYELPFTIAEGLAAAKGVPRERFLARAAPTRTARERQQDLDSAPDLAAELGRMPLTAACRALLARPFAERDDRWRDGLGRSAARGLRWTGPRDVHVVLDTSYSMRGGAKKRNHPLAVGLSVALRVKAACPGAVVHTTSPAPDLLHVRPRGQSRLAEPLLDALDARPELVIVVSDGFENDPPGGTSEVVRLFREHVDPGGQTAIVHLNPVFDATAFMPRPLGATVPTVGIRDAHDLPEKLAFARFTLGHLPLTDLESWLEARFQEATCA